MTAVMEGVRILEVAEHTFVPAASALLADWGAEVIKIEHVERGDAMRGLASSGLAVMGTNVHVLLEHSNRGKKSLGARPHVRRGARHPLQARGDLRRVPHEQAAERPRRSCASTSTTSAPTTRTSSTCGAPARASAGPTPTGAPTTCSAYWCRAGIAMGVKQPDYDYVPAPPAPAFGDSIGAMTIAGGIMGALFHRERTGEAHHRRRVAARHRHVVDGRGAGAVAPARGGVGPAAAQRADRQPAQRHLHDQGREVPHRSPACRRRGTGPRSCEVIGRPELATDERFADAAAITANVAEATDAAARGVRPAARPTSGASGSPTSRASGRWCRTRSRPPPTRRPSPTATCRTARPPRARRSSSPPRPSSSTGRPPRPQRAPEFNEHGDEILDRPRPRLGHDRGPQGPRRRRLSDPETAPYHRPHLTTHGATDMGTFDAFRYDGKRALVVGGATGMGAAAAELVKDAGAEVVVMDRAEITLPGVKAIQLDLADKASIDAAVDECGGPIARPVLVRRRRRRHARHRAHQLPRPPLHDRPAARRRPAAAAGSAIGMISSAAGWGWRQNLEKVERVPRHRRLRRGGRVGAGQRPRRLHVVEAVDLRLRRPRGPAADAAGRAHQRHPARADQHAARPGQQGDVAGLRRRLPRRGRHRGVDPARAGLPAGVPVQRRRPAASRASRW